MNGLTKEMLRRSEGLSDVVFDIGNTLLEWNKKRIAETYFPEDIRDTLFRALFVKDHTWHWMCFDRGEWPQEYVAQKIAEEAGCPQAAGMIMDAVLHFKDTLRPMPLTEGLQALRDSGKRLFALSNYPQPQANEALEMFPFFRLFTGWVISSDLKICKPDPRIYITLCDKYGIEPQKALFVDDLEENTAAAAALGFHVWHDFSAFYD